MYLMKRHGYFFTQKREQNAIKKRESPLYTLFHKKDEG